MAKGKKKNSQEKKEDVLELEKHPSQTKIGQTNLGFEPCEPGDIVKSRSKEDISTLNKNLDDTDNLKVTKKKKFKEKSNSERIENDLFDGENKTKKKTKKRKTSKKASASAAEQQDPETIELAPINNQGMKVSTDRCVCAAPPFGSRCFIENLTTVCLQFASIYVRWTCGPGHMPSFACFVTL